MRCRTDQPTAIRLPMTIYSQRIETIGTNAGMNYSGGWVAKAGICNGSKGKTDQHNPVWDTRTEASISRKKAPRLSRLSVEGHTGMFFVLANRHHG